MSIPAIFKDTCIETDIGELPFIGKDFLFLPQENSYEYGKDCAYEFLERVMDIACKVDKSLYTPFNEYFFDAIPSGQPVNDGFLDTIQRMLYLIELEKK